MTFDFKAHAAQDIDGTPYYYDGYYKAYSRGAM